jgi:subtilisin family serine protease
MREAYLNISNMKAYRAGHIFWAPAGPNNESMKHLYIFFTAVLLLAAALTAPAQTIHPDCMDGTIYFKTHDTSSVQLDPYNNNIAQLNYIISKYGVDSIRHAFFTADTSLQRIYRMDFQLANKVDSLVIEMMQTYFVEYAEKVDICLTSHTPNDISGNQWYLYTIDALQAWDITTGSPEVVVAIVDNAVRITHTDLVPNLWVNPGEIPNNGFDDDLNGYIDDVNGYDVADNDNDPNPPGSLPASSPFNHGTHCAGIAAAASNNSMGIASIGYNISIMAVKCSPDTSNGSSLTAAYEGIDYAISAGADIISMSFGSTSAPYTGQYLLNVARARGITLIAAAGNAASSSPNYPAAFNNVIAVGATDQLDHKASFSNFGNYVDVMAPGVNIYSTLGGNNNYGSLSGTSMATPLVAGLAGLILSRNSSFSPVDVENVLEAGCENIDAQNPNYFNQLGAGRINAYNSLSLVPASIGETLSHTVFNVYPNPNNGQFKVLLKENDIEGTMIRVVNPLGQIVYEEACQPGLTELHHDFSSSGLYLIELVKNNEITGRTKVIIRGK